MQEFADLHLISLEGYKSLRVNNSNNYLMKKLVIVVYSIINFISLFEDCEPYQK